MIVRHSSSSCSGRPRRGSVIIIVLWAIAVAAIITSSVQLFGQRQATVGREALERVQARWAARAGIEDTLTVMTDHTENPVDDDALAMFRDMYQAHKGDTLNASYDIYHHVEGHPKPFAGPMDEHSKININRESDRGLLLVLDDVTPDVVDALADWLDEDNDISTFGVERDWYQGKESPYLPRNGPVRSLGELELIAGIWPKYFRGEDWNLNNRLDVNEDDSARSMPPDDPDDVLDGEWSSRLTVYTVTGGATDSGQPRIYLRQATAEDLMDRLGVNAAQAEALIQYGSTPGNSLSDLISTPLGGAPAGGATSNAAAAAAALASAQENPSPTNRAGAATQPTASVAGLSEQQLRAVLAETTIEDPLDRTPGKINLNTISPDLLRDIITMMGLDDAIADEIISMRSTQARGILSLVDLQKIPNIAPEDLRAITRRFDTRSNVFCVTSRGRSWASGLEVEIVAVVDRSTVPIQILEYREQ